MTVYVVQDCESNHPDAIFFHRDRAYELKEILGRFYDVIKIETGDDPLTEYEQE